MANTDIPSTNFSNMGSGSGAFKEILDGFARRLQCCMPASIVSYDRANHTAVVQPGINIVTTNGQQVERAEMAVTVWRLFSGGYLVDLPLDEGDTGWVIAADRETSLFKSAGVASPPNTNEKHQYADGFFIPDKFGPFTLAEEDAGNFVIQNSAGTEKISIGESSTKITSAALTIDCPAVIFTGDITATGTVTGTTEVIAGTKLLKAHTHGTGAVTSATTLVNN